MFLIGLRLGLETNTEIQFLSNCFVSKHLSSTLSCHCCSSRCYSSLNSLKSIAVCRQFQTRSFALAPSLDAKMRIDPSLIEACQTSIQLNQMVSGPTRSRC